METYEPGNEPQDFSAASPGLAFSPRPASSLVVFSLIKEKDNVSIL